MFPGPKAIQFCVLPSQVDWYRSQSFPVSIHLAPLIFGDTSPKLTEANAATTRPYKGNKNNPLQGLCQGYGLGPIGLISVSNPIIKMMKEAGFGYKDWMAISKEVLIN